MCMKAGTLETEANEHQEDYVNDNRMITGVPSGFARLDEITGVFQKSDLIVVASRPGMGKTSLAINIARHAAVIEKLDVVFFTQEMKRDALTKRFDYLNVEQEQGVPENLVIIDYIHCAMNIMDE